MIRRRFCAEVARSAAIVAVGMAAGCGPSAPSDTRKSESELADAKKIQDLSKQGYDFADIRAIMKGEQPKSKPKKRAGGSRR